MSTTFIVTAKASGTEVYRYQAESPIEWAGMEFSTHSHFGAVITSFNNYKGPGLPS